MSKIVIGTAHGKNIGFDTDLLLATRLLITADSGGGKSWLARVLFEQAFGKLQIIIIDPEGEFASLREKYPFVLAGKGGDTPVDLRSAGMLAHRLLKLRVSAICDLYEMKSDQRHIWVRDFFNALIEAPKDLRVPLLLGVDEFHIFAPEKGQGESEAKQASIDIATRGRKRGICLAGITQRLAMLDKNVTSQLQNRLVGPTFEEVNIKTAVRLLGIVPGKEEREFHSQIQLLEPGNFFALGRAISRERILIKVREVETAHPKAFEKHTAPVPPTPEKIKGLLPQLADLPQEAEQKARTEAEFKREIRELKQQLKAAEKHAPKPIASAAPAHSSDPAQKQIIRQLRAALEAAMKVIAKITAFGFEQTKVNPKQLEQAVQKAVEEIGRQIAAGSEIRQKEFERLKREANTLLERLGNVIDKKLDISIDVIRAQPPFVLGPSRQAAPASAPAPRREDSTGGDADATRRDPPCTNGNGDLSGPEQKILKAMGELLSIGKDLAPVAMVAAWSGYSPQGGAFGNPRGALRSKGLIDYPEPGRMTLTESGRNMVGPQEPPDQDEIWRRIASTCTGPEVKILRALVNNAGADEMPKEQLAEKAGYSPVGGAFGNPIGSLRTKGLLDYPRQGVVKAADWLFAS